MDTMEGKSTAEAKRFLRSLELKAFRNVVDAFRAQGSLTSSKREVLKRLATALKVGDERYRSEIRRALGDNFLNQIAYCMNGQSTEECWVSESLRRIAFMPMVVAPTTFTALADNVSREVASQCSPSSDEQAPTLNQLFQSKMDRTAENASRYHASKLFASLQSPEKVNYDVTSAEIKKIKSHAARSKENVNRFTKRTPSDEKNCATLSDSLSMVNLHTGTKSRNQIQETIKPMKSCGKNSKSTKLLSVNDEVADIEEAQNDAEKISDKRRNDFREGYFGVERTTTKRMRADNTNVKSAVIRLTKKTDFTNVSPNVFTQLPYNSCVGSQINNYSIHSTEDVAPHKFNLIPASRRLKLIKRQEPSSVSAGTSVVNFSVDSQPVPVAQVSKIEKVDLPKRYETDSENASTSGQQSDDSSSRTLVYPSNQADFEKEITTKTNEKNTLLVLPISNQTIPTCSLLSDVDALNSNAKIDEELSLEKNCVSIDGNDTPKDEDICENVTKKQMFVTSDLVSDENRVLVSSSKRSAVSKNDALDPTEFTNAGNMGKLADYKNLEDLINATECESHKEAGNVAEFRYLENEVTVTECENHAVVGSMTEYVNYEDKCSANEDGHIVEQSDLVTVQNTVRSYSSIKDEFVDISVNEEVVVSSNDEIVESVIRETDADKYISDHVILVKGTVEDVEVPQTLSIGSSCEVVSVEVKSVQNVECVASVREHTAENAGSRETSEPEVVAESAKGRRFETTELFVQKRAKESAHSIAREQPELDVGCGPENHVAAETPRSVADARSTTEIRSPTENESETIDRPTANHDVVVIVSSSTAAPINASPIVVAAPSFAPSVQPKIIIADPKKLKILPSISIVPKTTQIKINGRTIAVSNPRLIASNKSKGAVPVNALKVTSLDKCPKVTVYSSSRVLGLDGSTRIQLVPKPRPASNDGDAARSVSSAVPSVSSAVPDPRLDARPAPASPHSTGACPSHGADDQRPSAGSGSPSAFDDEQLRCAEVSSSETS